MCTLICIGARRQSPGPEFKPAGRTCKIEILLGAERSQSLTQIVSENDPSSKIRTLHRNLLLPCEELPLEDPKQSDQRQQRKKETTRRANQVKPQQLDDSDSEDEISACIRPDTSNWKSTRPPTPHPVRGNVSDDAEVINDRLSEDFFIFFSFISFFFIFSFIFILKYLYRYKFHIFIHVFQTDLLKNNIK